VRIWIVAALVLSAGPSLAEDLAYRCDGTATVAGLEATSDRRPVPGMGNAMHQDADFKRRKMPAHIEIRITNGAGRIGLPVAMATEGADADGWRALSDLVVDAGAVSGRFEVTRTNKPTLTLDRGTGAVEIKGRAAFGFKGTCTAG
jgi:hypothetical protein